MGSTAKMSRVSMGLEDMWSENIGLIIMKPFAAFDDLGFRIIVETEKFSIIRCWMLYQDPI